MWSSAPNIANRGFARAFTVSKSQVPEVEEYCGASVNTTG